MKLKDLARRMVLPVGLALLSVALLLAGLTFSAGSAPARAFAVPAAGQPEAQAALPARPAAAAPRVQNPSRVASAPAAPPEPSRSAWPAPVSKNPAPAEAVRRAWQQARDAGAYRFVSDLAQMLYPAPSLANAGRTPEREELHLEGDVDLAGQTLQMKLWQGGGSVASPTDGAELRVADGKAYTRRLNGSAWQETPDFSPNFAPDGDALAFLAGIKHVRPLLDPAPGRSGAGWTASPLLAGEGPGVRYAFDLDGPTLARYLRDRLEQQLLEQGKLPQGVTIDTPQEYRDVTGHGELWLNAAGFPLRLVVHLAYPEARNGSHVEADVRTDFSGFAVQVASAPPLFEEPVAWAGSALGLTQPVHRRAWADAGRMGLALACGIAALALLVTCRRLRQVYAAVAVAVILSMVVVPLLQSERVQAFMDEQVARQAQQAQQQQDQETARELAGPAWDPHRDPLTDEGRGTKDEGQTPTFNPSTRPFGQSGQALQPSTSASISTSTSASTSNCDARDTADRDGDGLNNYEECLRDLDADDPDVDDDSLLDGVEVYQLGTDANDPDADGDFITDTLEVRGFSYNGRMWYLDPLNPDTDGDSLPDGAECSTLAVETEINVATVITACDTDSDGIPDPFDLDSDNDGVPDRMDLSPGEWTDRSGVHASGFISESLTPFDGDHRLALSLQGLQPGWPVLVDLHLRPVIGDHLNYALSVLDWPANATTGQIQHVKNTTYADFSATTGTSDEAGTHGDMRLAPMLEIELNGTSMPLSLTVPSATVTVGGPTAGWPGAPLTVTLRQDPANSARTLYTLSAGGSTVKIYTGTCPISGTSFYTLTATSGTLNSRVVNLADGNHTVVVTSGSSAACVDLPNVINGPYNDKMVDLSVLQPYGISVREVNTTADTPLLLYVPLNIVPDDTGGGKTAFLAHMLYWTGANNTWAAPQQVRLVWAVQALTDQCDATGFPATLAEYQGQHPGATQADYDAAYQAYCVDPSHRTPDNLQVVQTYDDSWYLTGLSVREDHGMYVAAAYENPAAPENATYPQPENDLWQLSLGLSTSFLSQRDCEDGTANSYDPMNGKCGDDGKRDLTLAKRDTAGLAIIGNSTVGERFDANSSISATYTFTDRWGIPAAALRVQTLHFAHQDQLADVTAQLTPGILQQLQAKYGTTVTPTVLFAREEYFRGAGLGAGAWDTAARLLTVNVDSATYPEQTFTAMNWQPYRYNSARDPVTGNIIGWEGTPISAEWDMLEDQFTGYFASLYPAQTEEDRQANEGRTKLSQSYYIALTQGMANTTDPCAAMASCQVKPIPNSSADLANGVKLAGKGAASMIMLAIEEYWLLVQRLKTSSPVGPGRLDLTDAKVLASLATGTGPLSTLFGAPGQHLLKQFSYKSLVLGAGLLVGVALFCVGVAIANAAKGANTYAIVAGVLQTVSVVTTSIGVVTAFGRVIKFAGKAGWGTLGATFAPACANFKKLFTSAKIFGFLGMVAGVVMGFVALLVQQYAGGLPVGSLQWDNALAGAIAGSLTTVLLYLILTALGPIGGLIQAVIALIDILVSLICSLAGATPAKSTAAKWLCGGLTGLVSNIFKWLIYSGNVIVDMQDPLRLQLDDFGYDLANPGRGMVAGNALYFHVTVTDTLKLAPIPSDTFWANAYSDQWSEDNLKRSNFTYRWAQSGTTTLHEGLELGGLTDKWHAVPQTTTGPQSFTYSKTVSSDFGIELTDTGLVSPTLYLAEGYAVPEQECWGLFPIYGYCWIHANRSTNLFNIGNELKIDVLPDSLGGFRALARKDTGWALSWGGGLTFPALYDADNDSLPTASDANDNLADADNDGLSDSYETEIGSNPVTADTDADGLRDGDEVRAGTNPRLKDSDGDGLWDKQELDGWEFVYGFDAGGNPLRTWVWADPLQVDGDGDTLTDFQEYTYGYNPSVQSKLNVLSLNSELSERGAGGSYTPTDGAVKPGDTLFYTATVKNELNNREAQGLLWAEGSAAFNTAAVPPGSFVLRAQEQSTTSGQLTVGSSAASGVYSLTQVAGALIANWGDVASGARLWLTFDDPAALYADRSGSLPPHDGTCVIKIGTQACAQDANGQYGSALKLTGSNYVHSAAEGSRTAFGVSLWFTTTVKPGILFSVRSANSGWVNPVIVGVNSAGKLCSKVSYYNINIVNYSYEEVCSAGTYADGQWHHVVHTFGKTLDSNSSLDGGQKLYVDGTLAASGSLSELMITTAGSDIGGERADRTTADQTSGLVGLIDDVRLFDHQLTLADVQSLRDKPVFAMDFEQGYAWQDVSPYAARVTCADSTCPSHGGGGSASFGGQNFLNAQGAGLNLSGGRLTLSAWIYPQVRGGGDVRDTFPQGILGFHSGEADGTAYPTLERVGRKIRFGFSTGSAWKSFTSTNDVLTENTWNHVVVSFGTADRTARLYINGALAEANTANFTDVPAIAPAMQLDIGRSGNLSTLTITKFHAESTGDGTCGALFSGEMCMALDGAQKVDVGDVGCGTNHTVNVATPFRESTSLRVWEDDGGTHCGGAADADDDVDSYSPHYFSSNTAGAGTEFSQSYDSAGKGTIYFKLANNSIPFYGRLDNVRIDNWVLDAATVWRLYQPATLGLRLPLDDAPGSTAFRQAGAGRAEAGCTSCPTAGLAGRMDQAAEFNGATNYLVLANGLANQIESEFTVAAWIKPVAPSGYQRIASTAFTKDVNGWGFGLSGANPTFSSYGVKEYTLTDTSLQTGRWYHLAAVLDAAHAVTFYVDGVSKGKISGSAGGVADTKDVLVIGASINQAGTAFEFFKGMIDEVQVYRSALSASQVQMLYDQAPKMHLRFDEAQGATQFADSARAGVSAVCTGVTACTGTTCCPTTGEAVKGQLGLAAHFDGQNQRVTLLDSVLEFDKFTVGGWVKPAGPKASRQLVLGKHFTNDIARYILSLAPSSLLPELQWGCPTYISLAGTVPLVQDHWNQVLGTYDGQALRLYVNGVETNAREVSSPGSCTGGNGAPVRIGGDLGASNVVTNLLAGDLDHLVVYNHALSPTEIYSLFAYQASWIEDRQSRNLTVDADNPTASVLVGDGTYLPKASVQVPIASEDASSGVASAQLCVNSDCGAAAPHCTDPARTSAWCPTFEPTGEGVFNLSAKATDRVGHTATSTAQPVRVDDSPPSLSLYATDGQRLDASRSAEGIWTVHLFGAASDPFLSGGGTHTPGSGVPADGVRVTLYKADGGLAGPQGQPAALSGSTWSLDYRLSEGQPAGYYTATVEAVDTLARTPGLDASQVARHTSTLSRIVGVNAAAPAVVIDRAGLIATGTLTTTATLGGVASARPVPVKLAWTTGAGGANAGLSLTCSGPGTPANYAPYKATAGLLGAGQSYSWAGQVQRDATCQVRLTAAAGTTGVVSGTVTVCGSQVATWSDNQSADRTVSFTASSATCPADSYSGQVATAGVGGVDVAFTPLLPGTPFTTEAPLAGEVLHLPFDEGAGATTFRDATAGNHNGTCSGATCPSAGQVGHAGSAAQFDGVDDTVSVPDNDALDFATGHDFTVMVWINPAQTQNDVRTTGNAIVEKWSGNGGYPYVIRYNNQTSGASTGKITAARWDGSHQPLVTSSRPVNDGRFHHVAFVKTGSTLSLFFDGVLDGQTSDTASGVTTNTSPLFIGQRGGYMPTRFTGLVDEVRIFDHSLTAAEIKALYLGAAPLLELDFEQPRASEGAVLSDSSGWGHDATLQAGAGDTANKIVAGETGSFALQLDGVDDYLNVGNSSDLKLSDRGTIAGWIYPTADTYGPIVNRGGEYEVFRYPDGTIQWAFANSDPGWDMVNTGYVAQLNTWTHVAVVYDAGVVRTYVNSVLVHTYNGAGTIGDADMDHKELWLGGWAATSARFAGRIDDIHLYQVALPAEEIRALYLAGWQAATLNASVASVASARWAITVPVGLEGAYRVDLRSRDAVGHAQIAPIWNTEALSSPAWSGPADSLAPRVTLCRALVSGSNYRYVTAAQDFNLVETPFTSPCGAGTITSRGYFASPWYVTAVAPGTQRLYQLTATCQSSATATPQARACDSAGNCATVGLTTGGACDAILAAPAAAVLDANAVAILQAEEAAAEAAAGRPWQPSLVFGQAVLTATHYYPPQALDVSGLFTGTRLAPRVEVTVGESAGRAVLSDPAAAWPFTRTWRYTYPLSAAALPDGLTVAAAATATLGAGLPLAQTEQPLTLDVVAPAAVALALRSGGDAVLPGATLRTAGPELALSWTPSTDGSGLAGYLARWTASSAETTTVATNVHDPAGPLEDRYTAGEAQRLVVELASQDRSGNQRWQALVPIYVDGPQTPDYIDLGAPGTRPYDGWLDSGCTLLGADRRLARSTYGGAVQQLYATWDRQALRLAWTGANWQIDGDLFVYLDTGPGGTHEVFTPFATPAGGTVVALPAGLAADTLVWVQTSEQATLLRWDGAAWMPVTPLSPAQFRFDAGRRGGETDLYLPFDLLGLSPASSLGLLAFAAEEPAEGESLQLWATLPLANPVNSPRVSRWAGLAPEGVHFSLFWPYRWAALGDGACPSGDRSVPSLQLSDSDLEVSITPDPAGLAFSGLGSGLFWVADPAPAAGVGGDVSALDLLRPRNPPIADGQAIAYTVRYHNRGSQEMAGVHLALTAYSQLRLLETAVNLGDIPAGGTGEAVFHGVADRSLGGLPVAGVKALVYDAAHAAGEPALEWLWVAHRVDWGAPEPPQLALGSRIGPRHNLFSGAALDDAGVREVTLELQGPAGTQQVTCAVARPAEGQWGCAWNADTPLPDGAELTVRAQATDIFGQVGEWSPPVTVLVDARPPTVTLNFAASRAQPGGVVGGDSLTLYGLAGDAGGVAAVNVCLRDASVRGEETCSVANLRAGATPAGDRWSYRTPAFGALDYVSRTLTIAASDSLGNRMAEPLALEVRVDNVAPTLVAGQLLTEVVLGRSTAVLSGTVDDGGPAVDVSGRVQPPWGDAFRADTRRADATWRYDLPADLPGPYVLWVDADDLAGNRSSAGPFTVTVTCTDAALAVTALTAEPSANAAVSLTLHAQLANAGPDLLPAGIPVAFYARDAQIGTVTTTQGLAAGASLALTLGWAPAAAGDWELAVALGAGETAVAGTVLCRTPATARFTLEIADVPLYSAWNLVAPPVAPFDPDILTVQRPISGSYAAILGYEGGLRWFHPQGPDHGALTTIHAGRGYWIRETRVPPPPQPGDEDEAEPAIAVLRLVGQRVAEDQPLALAAGWNLAGYLPRAALGVTVALGSIDGAYAAVLGFVRTGLSYYPDVERSYNTLQTMAPGAGYWISATQAITLQYPLTALTTTLPITATPTLTETLAHQERLVAIQAAEQAAGVRPTYAWANLYGRVYLPDGRPGPVSTTVTALAGGVPCGATVVTDEGRFGLLACYGDDETTPAVDGARPGDGLTFLVNGAPATARPLGFNGEPVPGWQTLRWTGHGDRWEVAVGVPLAADLAIAKTVQPTTAQPAAALTSMRVQDVVSSDLRPAALTGTAFTSGVQPAAAQPGAAITYTLAFSNQGNLLAQGVVISDRLPAEVISPAFTSAGVAVTPTTGSPAFVWQVADLPPGAGGVITVTGSLSPALAAEAVITNTAVITAPQDAFPENNVAQAALQVGLPPTITAWPPAQAAQYSDGLPETVITATDVAGETPLVTTAWRGPDGAETPGLPAGLALAADTCADAAGRRTCRWTLAGALGAPAGAYTITVRATDRFGLAQQAEVQLAVTPEAAAVTLAAANPATVTVSPGGAASGPFTLAATAQELWPDLGASPAPGDLGQAVVTLRLLPAEGAPLAPEACDPVQVVGSGYTATLTLRCAFDAVPLGRYTVQAQVTGGYYAGAATGVLEVAPAASLPKLWLPVIMQH